MSRPIGEWQVPHHALQLLLEAGQSQQPVRSLVQKTLPGSAVCCASYRVRLIQAEFACGSATPMRYSEFKGLIAKFRRILFGAFLLAGTDFVM